MGRLLLVRHAQSTWNAAGRWQGWSDAPLSDLGRRQAEEAGRSLAALGLRPDLVACSDLARARATAEALASALAYGRELVVDPDLREQDLGEWNGLERSEIEARWPEELAGRSAGRLGPVPGGEAAEHFASRCSRALARLAASGAEDVVVVAHGGVVIATEQALGVSSPDRRHANLGGWWLQTESSGSEVQLRAVAPVDLLAMGQAPSEQQ